MKNTAGVHIQPSIDSFKAGWSTIADKWRITIGAVGSI